MKWIRLQKRRLLPLRDVGMTGRATLAMVAASFNVIETFVLPGTAYRHALSGARTLADARRALEKHDFLANTPSFRAAGRIGRSRYHGTMLTGRTKVMVVVRSGGLCRGEGLSRTRGTAGRRPGVLASTSRHTDNSDSPKRRRHGGRVPVVSFHGGPHATCRGSPGTLRPRLVTECQPRGAKCHRAVRTGYR